MLNAKEIADIYLNRILISVGVLTGIITASYFIKKSIGLLFSQFKGRVGKTDAIAKTRTIYTLMRNIIDAGLILAGGLIILSSWGINIFPILTGAGILGLAFSFGAQTLVKDIISGFFIIVENQFNIGDKVEIGKLKGEVYRMTLRMTVLKDSNGSLIYIPNSQITTVIRLKES